MHLAHCHEYHFVSCSTASCRPTEAWKGKSTSTPIIPTHTERDMGSLLSGILSSGWSVRLRTGEQKGSPQWGCKRSYTMGDIQMFPCTFKWECWNYSNGWHFSALGTFRFSCTERIIRTGDDGGFEDPFARIKEAELLAPSSKKGMSKKSLRITGCPLISRHTE